MEFTLSHYTEIGTRENNEDAVLLRCEDQQILAVVADGLGGYEGGQVASGLVASSLEYQLINQSVDEDLLIDAIQKAGEELYITRGEQKIYTTVASLWLCKQLAVAAHVGDSRIYQFREDRIIFQSKDHSMAQMAVLVGEINEAEMRTYKGRNRLTRALGVNRVTRIDSELLTVAEGDRFLLCSDGFWEAVTETAMIEALHNTDTAQQWLDKMRKIVRQQTHSQQDNHTACAIIIEST